MGQGPGQGGLAAEYHIAVADDRAGLTDPGHILRDMEGEGAELASHDGVEQDDGIPDAGKGLMGPKELAAIGRFQRSSSFR